jgi:hypothetical protein
METNLTEAQSAKLTELKVDVGESYGPDSLGYILVFANRHNPAMADLCPYELDRSGAIRYVRAGYPWSGVRYHQNEKSIHAEINAVVRKAARIASKVTESAMDSGCTDTKPTGTAGARAWDMVAYAHVLNRISDIPTARAAWGFES